MHSLSCIDEAPEHNDELEYTESIWTSGKMIEAEKKFDLYI